VQTPTTEAHNPDSCLHEPDPHQMRIVYFKVVLVSYSADCLLNSGSKHRDMYTAMPLLNTLRAEILTLSSETIWLI